MLHGEIASDVQSDWNQSNNGKSLEISAGTAYFKDRDTGILSSNLRAVSGFPKAFKDKVETVALASLHLFQSGEDTNETSAQAAFKSAYDQVLASTGAGSFKWDAMSSAAPGVHNPGMINLVQDSPIQYFGIEKIGGGKTIEYLEPFIMNYIKKNMHRDHKPGWADAISFDKNIRLEVAGYKHVETISGNEVIPMYSIRILDNEGYTTIYDMRRKGNQKLIIDLENEYIRQIDIADWAVFADHEAKRTSASIRADESAARTKGLNLILSGKGNRLDQTIRPSIFDPNVDWKPPTGHFKGKDQKPNYGATVGKRK